MKIIDFTGKKYEGQFKRQTIMVMCFTPKVIVFEEAKELYKFKAVWELLDDLTEDNEALLDAIGYDTCSWYVDAFEEEEYLVDCKEYSDRIFTLKDISDMDDANFEDFLMVKFGVLNSKDIWTDMETLEKHCFLLNMLLERPDAPELLKPDTIQMLKDILAVWEEDVRLSKEEDRKYFKIEIEIEEKYDEEEI